MSRQRRWIGVVIMLALVIGIIPSGTAQAASYKATKYKSYDSAINSRKKIYGGNSANYAYVNVKTKYGIKKTVFAYGIGCTSSATTVYNYMKYKGRILQINEFGGVPVAISKDKKYIYVDWEFTTGVMGFTMKYSDKSGTYEDGEVFNYEGAGDGYEAEKEFRKKYGLEKNNIKYKSTYKTIKADASCQMYQKGNWIYYHDSLGNYKKHIKAGYYKYNIKTKKKKFLCDNEIDGEFIVKGKYIYIHGFKYDDDHSWITRVDTNGKGKKRLFTTTKADWSRFFINGNMVYLPTKSYGSYVTYNLKTGKKKNVENANYGLKFRKGTPGESSSGKVTTGDLSYEISSEGKSLTRGNKSIYKCSQEETIGEAFVHKESVVLNVFVGAIGTKNKIVYVNKNGKNKKVLRGTAPCYN